MAFELALATLGNLLGKSFAINKLNRMFKYRHPIAAHDLALHKSNKGGMKMKILISGSSGLIGSALVAFLTSVGHEVIKLVRRTEEDENGLSWDPYSETVDKSKLEGFDAVVNLSGETIADKWTDEKKKKIHDSRVNLTKFLSITLTELENPPKTLICASAIGYYGDRSDELLTEDSSFGAGYLPEVVREWEAATVPASVNGIRVANMRFGLVLSPQGGALAKMLPPFKMGVGGIVGSGKQYWSWIALEDVVGAIHHALTTESLKGAVNVVAPIPVTNREFTKCLGKVLGRPTVFPMPAVAVRLAFGEMGDALLLASARVEPTKLKNTGYEFRFTALEDALRNMLGRTG